MPRSYYTDSIDAFRLKTPQQILGELTENSTFAVDIAQRDAWLGQIGILQPALAGYEGSIHLEYAIPRMGKRIDAVLFGGDYFGRGILDWFKSVAGDLFSEIRARDIVFLSHRLYPAENFDRSCMSFPLGDGRRD